MTEELIKRILTEELFGCSICESVYDKQIVELIYSNLLLEKLLYGEEISVVELRKLLRKKIVNFEFIKLDGEVRPARGSTNMKYIPPKDHPKGIRPSSPKVATFYDLDKDAWRSVSKRSKEIVLKRDEETKKPIVVVRDKSEVKVKAISKERESKDPIKQGNTYKYKTNRGTNTYIKILRELSNGLYQVSSPVFKTTFAVAPWRIGNKIKPETEVKKVKAVEKPKIRTEEPKELRFPKEPQESKFKEEKPTKIILPTEVKEEKPKEEQVKKPPLDITPPFPDNEDEGPEELQK